MTARAGRRCRKRRRKRKQIGGGWRFDSAPLFDNPSPGQTELGIFVQHISTRAIKEVTQEVANGKYADWPTVKRALNDRMRTMQLADMDFQNARKANRGV